MPPTPSQRRRADPSVIAFYENGPFLVRGDVEIRDQQGDLVRSRRRTVALCRCGRSKLRPLCDGTHRTTGFRAPGTLETAPTAAVEPPVPARGRDGDSDSAADILAAIRTARHTVREALPEVDPGDALHRAEPLLAAAEALIRWQLDGAGPLPVVRDDGDDLDAGPDAARSAIGAAMKGARQLALDDEPTADQVRSLVRDAASCLRRGAEAAGG